MDNTETQTSLSTGNKTRTNQNNSTSNKKQHTSNQGLWHIGVSLRQRQMNMYYSAMQNIKILYSFKNKNYAWKSFSSPAPPLKTEGP